jgi:hypothetical protein
VFRYSNVTETISRAFAQNQQRVLIMKKSKIALAIAMTFTSAIALASGYNGSNVSVNSGSSEFSEAVGMYTYAQNAGSASGSAFLVSNGAVAMGNYATEHSGVATGYYNSQTVGQGGGGVDLSIHRGNVAADSGTGQQQQSVTSGGYYFDPYYGGYYGMGGMTAAEGAGSSSVAGATGWGTNFTAQGSDAQNAQSGGYYYDYYGGMPSVVSGGETASGSIVSSFGGWHH